MVEGHLFSESVFSKNKTCSSSNFIFVLFAVRIISYYCTDRSNKKLVTKCGARQHFKQRAYVSEFI